ncbi:GNAT family N-acetyltransferase [Marinomonas spartinae]|uniref:GNAT family N-acetyltransferase n=1 Tax=Marinomonas spartinae TaxID=1792290 RepID=UPI0018F1411A|nr:GNAT family N-acetyltransferase [Marinomonas spartinae]MBJ7554328.1 GNAT family N-acetyltransferase [Marinomonas spartinae]
MNIRKSLGHEVEILKETLYDTFAKNIEKNEALTHIEANEKAKNQLDSLFENEADNAFFSGLCGDVLCGYLWLIKKNETLFIAYIFVGEKFRRKGYASKLLKWSEEYAKDNGFKKIGLHVFENNTAAYNLYKSNGYKTTNIAMQKLIT